MKSKFFLLTVLFIFIITAVASCSGSKSKEDESDDDDEEAKIACLVSGDEKVVMCLDDNGFEGLQAMVCGEDGVWEKVGDCVARAPACDEGEEIEVACGYDGQEQVFVCENGNWIEAGDCQMPEPCENGAIKEIVCGYNQKGTMRKVCIDGVWREETECIYNYNPGDMVTRVIERTPDGRVSAIYKYEYYESGALMKRSVVSTIQHYDNSPYSVLSSDTFLENGKRIKTFNGTVEREFLRKGDEVFEDKVVKETTYTNGVITRNIVRTYRGDMSLESVNEKVWNNYGNLIEEINENYTVRNCAPFMKERTVLNGYGELVVYLLYNNDFNLVTRKHFMSPFFYTISGQSTLNLQQVQWLELEYDNNGLLSLVEVINPDGTLRESYEYSHGRGYHVVTREVFYDKTGKEVVINEWEITDTGRMPVKQLCETVIPDYAGIDRCPKWELDEGEYYCAYPANYPECSSSGRVWRDMNGTNYWFNYCDTFHHCLDCHDKCLCDSSDVEGQDSYCLKEWDRDLYGKLTSYERKNRSGTLLNSKKYNTDGNVIEETCNYHNCHCGSAAIYQTGFDGCSSWNFMGSAGGYDYYQCSYPPSYPVCSTWSPYTFHNDDYYRYCTNFAQPAPDCINEGYNNVRKTYSYAGETLISWKFEDLSKSPAVEIVSAENYPDTDYVVTRQSGRVTSITPRDIPTACNAANATAFGFVDPGLPSSFPPPLEQTQTQNRLYPLSGNYMETTFQYGTGNAVTETRRNRRLSCSRSRTCDYTEIADPADPEYPGYWTCGTWVYGTMTSTVDQLVNHRQKNGQGLIILNEVPNDTREYSYSAEGKLTEYKRTFFTQVTNYKWTDTVFSIVDGTNVLEEYVTEKNICGRNMVKERVIDRPGNGLLQEFVWRENHTANNGICNPEGSESTYWTQIDSQNIPNGQRVPGITNPADTYRKKHTCTAGCTGLPTGHSTFNEEKTFNSDLALLSHSFKVGTDDTLIFFREYSEEKDVCSIQLTEYMADLRDYSGYIRYREYCTDDTGQCLFSGSYLEKQLRYTKYTAKYEKGLRKEQKYVVGDSPETGLITVSEMTPTLYKEKCVNVWSMSFPANFTAPAGVFTTYSFIDAAAGYDNDENLTSETLKDPAGDIMLEQTWAYSDDGTVAEYKAVRLGTVMSHEKRNRDALFAYPFYNLLGEENFEILLHLFDSEVVSYRSDIWTYDEEGYKLTHERSGYDGKESDTFDYIYSRNGAGKVVHVIKKNTGTGSSDNANSVVRTAEFLY